MMDWSLSTWWWIAAGVLVAAELATGTFYLLMLALGAATAALAAWAGAGLSLQLLAAALVGGGAVVLWHLKRGAGPAVPPLSENRDVNIDVGEEIEVTEWQLDGAGHALYRGARWEVRHSGGGTPRPGRHVIRSVEGNRLHVQALNRESA
jgi:membrane protein implicated in regulation of membrane protease activity